MSVMPEPTLPVESASQRPTIEVVGLGPAGPDLLTAGTLALLDGAEVCRLRTARHPAAAVIDAPSFDHLYESAATFDEVYVSIVAELVALATAHERVLYAVPGSPAVAEHTVELLRARTDVRVVVHPALSFADLTWSVLGVDPIADGVRIVDGHRFATEAAGERGPLLVAQCHDRATLSEIKLAVDAGPELQVTVVQRLGLDDQTVVEVAWPDLDRSIEPDHLTSIYMPELPNAVGASFARFAAMVERLRAECPWDAEQTHGSLRRYLLEESYETLEALDLLVAADDEVAGEGVGGDAVLAARYADLQEELGDLLYQIFFHSILASEQGWFDVAAVAQGIHDKLLARHPHVFGDEVVTSLDDLAAQWEASKVTEKSRESVMDGIPAALPALLYSSKVQKKAAAIGVAVPEGVIPRSTVPADVRHGDASMVAEVLFEAVALARTLGVDPESALRERAVAFADEVRRNGH